jgi:hypothetical protein
MFEGFGSVTYACGTCRRPVLNGGMLAQGETWACGHRGRCLAVLGGPDSLDAREVWKEVEPTFADRFAAFKARKAGR